MCFQKLVNSVKDNPLEAFLGVCVVALIMFAASVKDVASSVLVVFLLFGLSKAHHLKSSWRCLKTIEKAMLIAFLFHVLSGLISYVNVEDTYEYIKQMDRYIRFLFIIPIVLAAIYSKLDFEKYFFTGIVLSGPAYFYFAIESVLENPGLPAGNDYHHITFGGAVTLNALLMLLVLVLEPWQARWKVLVMISMSLSLYASVLSQARGAWIAIPAALLIIFTAFVRQARLKLSHALLVLVMLVAGVFITPAGDVVKDRFNEGVNEVRMFVESGDASTSNGGRLALWDISINVWKSSPLFGTGPGDFDSEVKLYQSKGIYQGLFAHSSVHNIYLQALSNTGLIGFFVMIIAFVILPLWYFASYIKKGINFGYYGFMLVLAYAIFGLTESWILRAPVVSMYIIYFVVMLLVCRHREEKS